MKGTVVAVCLSEKKGTTKHQVPEGVLKTDFGLEGDAHAGEWHRQVSLLAEESIEKMRSEGLDIGYGDFAENITTRGLVLHELPVGTQLKIGSEVLLEITQIGKECHHGCAIAQKVGHCIMPREGVFAKVLRGGRVRPGDEITVLSRE